VWWRFQSLLSSQAEHKQQHRFCGGLTCLLTFPPQVDVYSFGVVLWEICTGRVPTRGRLADPDVPGDCPADILMLIRECMQAGSSPTL
jgi:serine/threonine protein kinase